MVDMPPQSVLARPRVLVLGTTGSGKTTVGRRIAEQFGTSFVELDAINWMPNWTERPVEQFRDRVAEAVSGDAWVIDGNYSKGRDITIPKANVAVWLDYPFWSNLLQLLERTFCRWHRGEVLWNGNRERLWTHFLTKDSLILWFFRTYWSKKREYAEMLYGPDWEHITVVRLRSRGETNEWLAKLPLRDN